MGNLGGPITKTRMIVIIITIISQEEKDYGLKNLMMQRTANENAACIRRICKRPDQPKIER